MSVSRDQAARLGQETLRILEAGGYRSPSGARVDLRPLLERAVQATRSYPPQARLPEPAAGPYPTSIQVTNETTLSAAARLAAGGARPVALNFASARRPGGGFLSGARAQEESLARASALYACLEGDPMYQLHAQRSDPLYSSYAIYSPDVPVFRDDAGMLLEQPYLCAFITAPAPNAKVVLERSPERRAEVLAAMEQRIARVLTIGVAHGHEAIVLGAWGCGVFGNDPREVARLFHQALSGPFAGCFAQVVFAILDWSHDRHFIGPFQRLFDTPATGQRC